MDVGWGEQDSGSWWPDQYVVPSPAQPSPAPGANVTESSGECQSQQPPASSHHAASHLVPHIKYRSTQILLLKRTPLFKFGENTSIFNLMVL